MRALLQRVTSGQVAVAGEVIGAIDRGFVILLGVTHTDIADDIELLVTKIANLRIFEDADGVMNRSALELNAQTPDSIGMLIISQFTLYADVRKGRRPSFVQAAKRDIAEPLVEQFVARMAAEGLIVAQGRFGAEMQVSLVNDGPVTIWLDTDDLRAPKSA